MTIYIVFGDYSQKIAEHLSKEFTISGFSRTMEAAIATITDMKEKPDVFLILSSAVVTGVVNGVINYNSALLVHLKKIRLSCPDSRIKIIVSEKSGQALIDGIVALGIYDIFKTDKIKIEELPFMITTNKTIANHSDNIKKTISESTPKSLIEVVNEKDKNKRQSIFQLVKDNETLKRILKKTERVGQQSKEAEPNNFVYEIHPFSETNQEPQKDIQILQPKLPLEHTGSANAKIIAVAGPWASGGVTVLTAALTNLLTKTGKIAAVDCDLAGKGLAERLGIRVSENDWRKGDSPIALSSGGVLYPLNPGIDTEIDEDMLKDVVFKSGIGSEIVLLDIGSNPDAWWFKNVSQWAGLLIWVARNDPLLLRSMVTRWSKRPKSKCREVMVLHGEGEANTIENIFTLPCVQVRDGRGVKALAEVIRSVPARNGLRVLTAGFKDVPDMPGVVCDSFINADEAIIWLENNKPDIAVIFSGLEKNNLLEFDLRKHSIPVYKADNHDALLQVIRKIC